MAKISDKQIVSTAVENVTDKGYQQDHVTSQCFMRPMVAFAREKPATRSMTVKAQDFIRLLPLPVPTFGRALVQSRAFFVPYRTIWKDFNGFINQSPVARSGGSFAIPSRTPYISNQQFISSLVTKSNLVTSGSYDFKLDNGNMYKLSTFGQFEFKVLEQLGYKINFNLSDTYEHCALPLLAYMKVMLDWYYPSQYAYDSQYNVVAALFDQFYLEGSSIPAAIINSFFDNICYCSYDADYFASAWDNPVGPNSNTYEGNYSIRDVTYDVGAEVSGNPVLASQVNNESISNGTPGSFVQFDNGSGGLTRAINPSSFTKYMHEMLSSMTDYTRRHSLAGVRAVDRYLAEYGISLSAEILRRSIYFGYSQHTIQFGDVYSTSDTASQGGDNLGDYAGKGAGYGQGTFTYDNRDEFGFFLIINSVVPKVGYYQGQVKDTMRSNVFDFYHGDYNGKGVEAISKREFYVPMDGTSVDAVPATLNEGVYGFIPRDGSLHCGFDRVTGLFNLDSVNSGLNAYYLQRYVSGLGSKVHSVNSALGTDYLEYNRIFFNSSKEVADYMIGIFHFEVEYSDALAPLWDSYDFEKSYKKVKMNVGGTTVN